MFTSKTSTNIYDFICFYKILKKIILYDKFSIAINEIIVFLPVILPFPQQANWFMLSRQSLTFWLLRNMILFHNILDSVFKMPCNESLNKIIIYSLAKNLPKFAVLYNSFLIAVNGDKCFLLYLYYSISRPMINSQILSCIFFFMVSKINLH